MDEQRIRYGGSSAAISLWISLWFNCCQAFLVWYDVDCREAAQGVSDERGLSERSGLVRHSDRLAAGGGRLHLCSGAVSEIAKSV